METQTNFATVGYVTGAILDIEPTLVKSIVAGEEEKAEAGINAGEQFRRVKRALLAVGSAAILFGLAEVGPTFDPQVFGHGVQIHTWVLSAFFLAYLLYLHIEFEFEHRSVYARYNKNTYDPARPEDDPQNAMRRLVEPIERFGSELAQITARIQTLRAITDGLENLPGDWKNTDFSRASGVAATIKSQLERAKNILFEGVGKQRPPVLDMQLMTATIDASMSELSGAILEDVQTLVDNAKVEANVRVNQNKELIEERAAIQARVDEMTKAISSLNVDVTRLSDALDVRHRRMFRFHSVLVTRAVSIAAMVITSYDLVLDVAGAYLA